MGEVANHFFQDHTMKMKNNWLIKSGVDFHGPDTHGDSKSMDSSYENSSSSETDLTESSSSSSNGPLYELSELMHQLPIKRGLSKYYQGKSQSHTSLASVRSIEDLAKKGSSSSSSSTYSKRMKSCQSYANVLDGHKLFYTPKATISKKTQRGASFLSDLSISRTTLMTHCKPTKC